MSVTPVPRPKADGTATPRVVPPADAARQAEGALRLLQLEAEVRRAATLRELVYHLANESRSALEFRQAFVLRRRRGRMRVEAISSVSTVERNAPLVRRIERAVARLEGGPGLGEAVTFEADGADGADGGDYAFRQMMWVPLKTSKGRVHGGLVAARERAWSERLVVIGTRLGETYGHAWRALEGGRDPSEGFRFARLFGLLALAGMVAAGFVPVPITAIAPVEVVGQGAAIIAAPLDGAVAEVLVAPNDLVAEGQVLVRFEDTELRNAAEIAERGVFVAASRVEAATSGAFADADARREIAVARAELALAEAERDLAAERLERTEIRAPVAGLAVFADARDWIGRPVAVGERIMEIADPARVEYQVTLPVDDLIALSPDIPLRVFLDSAPLAARRAALTRASYHAETQPDGVLAYELVARDEAADAPPPRIGSRGTAQVLGPDAPLGFVLFRRPISWARQTFGF